MKKVLFSCVGMTDPVRGLHDGPILHIMRYYRPDEVCLFLSPQITALDQKDSRIQKMWNHMREKWDGYSPELQIINADLKDVSDMDEMNQPLTDAFVRFWEEHPGTEFLVNLSSGAPQMQMILSQLALDIRYHARGVQVKNFEKEAGTTERTNKEKYDCEVELELSEEIECGEEAENRCTEPQMIAIRQDRRRQQVIALLERCDYAAIADMPDGLPDDVYKLAKHLDLRNSLQTEEAKKAARGLSLPFSLFPLFPNPARESSEYREVSEYFLMMKNLLRTQRYTDFVLRLDPFVVALQCAQMDRLMTMDFHVSLSEVMTGSMDRRKISAEKLREKTPTLYDRANELLFEKTGRSLQDGDPSIFLCNLLLGTFPAAEVGECLELFRACEQLKSRRNQAAHQLRGVTGKMIEEQSGMKCSKLEGALEKAVQTLYPECDPALFQIYRKCEEYIRNQL